MMDAESRTLFAEAGVTLSEDDEAFFERLRDAVLRGNSRMNLTRLTEPRDFYLKHVLDSVFPFTRSPTLKGLPNSLLAADLGSGAGFPGLVLARLYPGWDVALIERTQKKAGFLEDTIEELEIGNAYVVPFDAREAIRQAPVLRKACRVVLARAVGRIAAVTELGAPLLAPKSVIVHYKGGLVDATELDEGAVAARRRRLTQLPPDAYTLPPDTGRSVVLTLSPPKRQKRTGARRPTRAT